MKPYAETAATTPEQKHFNYRQSRARMVVENAFGRLKGRWRCLLKRLDFKLENVPNVVSSCVVLHNMCEMYGDNFCSEWMVARDETNTSNITTPINSNNHGNKEAIRNAITTYLWSECN